MASQPPTKKPHIDATNGATDASVPSPASSSAAAAPVAQAATQPPTSPSTSQSASVSASASSSSSSTPAPPLPHPRPHFSNLLGTVVLEDNVRILSDFLYRHCQTPDVEIEGKLGLLFHPKKGSRVHIDGVRQLIAVQKDEIPETSFAAEIDLNMFRHLNEDLLQRRYLDDQAKAKQHNARPYWTYTRVRETDKFYTVGTDRVRVSTNASGEVTACVVKEKIEHLDFYHGKPKSIDFRISANRERKVVDLPKNEPDQIRRKDRLSYRFDLWKIELTKVELYNGVTKSGHEPLHGWDRPTQTSYEVEVEIRHLDYLKQEAVKVSEGRQPNDFVRMAAAFLDQMRTLSLYAWPGQMPPGWKAPAAVHMPQQMQQQQQQTAASKKRQREEEEGNKDEYGKAWS